MAFTQALGIHILVLRLAWLRTVSPESSSQPHTVTFDSVNDMVTNRQMVYITGWKYRTERWPAGEGGSGLYMRAHVVLRLISYLRPLNCFCNFLFNILDCGGPQVNLKL